jgi:uncharacterized membrane protein (DUF2068 family)
LGLALGVQAAVLIFHPFAGASFTNIHLRPLFPSAQYEAGEILIVAVIGAVFSLVIGSGLWFLQDWARWGMLLATGIPLGCALFFAAITFTTNPSVFGKYFGVAFWFLTLVCGAMVLYLTQPGVQRAFTGRREFYDAYGMSELDSPEPLHMLRK